MLHCSKTDPQSGSTSLPCGGEGVACPNIKIYENQLKAPKAKFKANLKL